MDRSELEELGRKRVAETKSRFDSARDHTNAVVRAFPLADKSPDGRYAYQRAVRLENAVLAEYSRVRGIFSDLVLRGVKPPEDANARGK